MSSVAAAAAAEGKGHKDNNNSDNRNRKGKVWVYLALLTLQYGCQPLLSKRFVRREAIVTSLVLACEVAKALCALLLLSLKPGALRSQFRRWSLSASLAASGLPAAIYAVQNSLLQISYKNLDSLTFSILNQTKLLFTALFAFLLLGQRQSRRQILALALLLLAAVLLSVGEGAAAGPHQGPTPTPSHSRSALLHGILPVLAASLLSGLASALCQWASQVKKHTSYLMTVEMSVIGSLCLLASMPHSPDGRAIRNYGFFHAWTPWTLVNKFHYHYHYH